MSRSARLAHLVIAVVAAGGALPATLTVAGMLRVREMIGSFTVPGEPHICAYPRNPETKLPVGPTMDDRLATIPGVVAGKAFHFANYPTHYSDATHHDLMVNGAGQGWVERFARPPYIKLTPSQVDAWYREPAAMILTERTLKAEGWQPDQWVTWDADGITMKGQVRFIVPDGIALLDKIVLHSDFIDTQIAPERRLRSSYVMIGVEPDQTDRVRARIEALYDREGAPAWTFTLPEIIHHLVRDDERLSAMRELLGYASLACLLTMAAMLSIVRTTPSTRPHALLSALVGALCGGCIAWFKFHQHGFSMGSWIFEEVTVNPTSIALATAYVVVIAVGATLLEIVIAHVTRDANRWVLSGAVMLAVAAAVWVGGSVFDLREARERTLSTEPDGTMLLMSESAEASATTLAAAKDGSLDRVVEGDTGAVASSELAGQVGHRPGPSGQVTTLVVRGITDAAFSAHGASIREGRRPRSGERGVLVGSLIRGQFPGDAFRIGTHQWPIIGVMDAHGSEYDSEVWCDREMLLNEIRAGDGSTPGFGMETYVRSRISLATLSARLDALHLAGGQLQPASEMERIDASQTNRRFDGGILVSACLFAGVVLLTGLRIHHARGASIGRMLVTAASWTAAGALLGELACAARTSFVEAESFVHYPAHVTSTNLISCIVAGTFAIALTSTLARRLVGPSRIS